MRLDHLIYAAEPDGLRPTVRRLADRLGVDPEPGGYHPRLGTRMTVLPLAGGCYVGVLDGMQHPVAEKAALGRAIRARTAAGGGWSTWGVAVDDMHEVERRLRRAATMGSRYRPDGVELVWKQLTARGGMADASLPQLVCWSSPPSLHPSVGGAAARLLRLRLRVDPAELERWLGAPVERALVGVDVEWERPTGGLKGIVTATFETRTGAVEI